MSDGYCYSRPVPDQVKKDGIPTELYRQAVRLYDETFPNNNAATTSSNTTAENLAATPTACPLHIRNLQLVARAPTLHFPTDYMMPGFVKELCEQGYGDIGRYHIGRVQIKINTTTTTTTTTTQNNDNNNNNNNNNNLQWIDVALVVNEGDADRNTGFWGGAFQIMAKETTDGDGSLLIMTLTPIAWIRSVGDTETAVEQAKSLPPGLLELDSDDQLEFDSSVLLNGKDEENEENESDERQLFGHVGAACCQMMRHENRNFVNIPPVEKRTRDDDNKDN